MKIYLAARFSRQEELCKYARSLETLGHVVTSRWLTGKHGWSGISDHMIPAEEQAVFAREDLEDVEAADLIICFTEPSGSGPARGGRHVEFGYALARGKRCMVVGPHENVFYTLPTVMQYDDWDAAKSMLGRVAEITRLRALING